MIVGLFPELSSTGGIPRSGCLTALALASFAAQRGERCRFVSLSDPAGAGSLKTGGRVIRFTGCGRSKMHFVSTVCRLAIRQPRLVVALHPCSWWLWERGAICPGCNLSREHPVFPVTSISFLS